MRQSIKCRSCNKAAVKREPYICQDCQRTKKVRDITPFLEIERYQRFEPSLPRIKWLERPEI